VLSFVRHTHCVHAVLCGAVALCLPLLQYDPRWQQVYVTPDRNDTFPASFTRLSID
jgi:hypothetical protein